MKKRGREEKYFAFSQIFLLIISMFAFSFIIYQTQFISAFPSLPTGLHFKPAKLPTVSYLTGLAKDERSITLFGSKGNKLASGALKLGAKGSLSVGGTAIKAGANGGLIVGGKAASSVAYNGLWAGVGNGFLGNLAQGAIWAAGVLSAIQLFGPMFGLQKGTTNALSMSFAIGILTAKVLTGAAQQSGLAGTFGIFGETGPFGLSAGAWVGIGVGVIVFLMMFSKEKQETITFNCRPWQAPVGGENCEKCNSQDLPCSEYQCKSLGQACDLINKGTSKEKCVWINRQDINPPIIKPSENALLKDYRYSPDNAISPPDKGVKILYEKSRDHCAPAFTPLKFGIKLNEPAACKIDTSRKKDFKDMRAFMDGGLLEYNHSFTLSLPGKEALASQNITLQNGGNYGLYVRCRDANGNANIANFVFEYCINKGPDTTPPLIITTNILNNAPIAFNQSSVNLEAYVNEPSQCKWSHNDEDYSLMEQTMNCSSSIFDFNTQSLYKCSTTLTGLKNRVENKFYFRCKDKPNAPENERNVDSESYKFTLIGTQPLVIDSVSPDNTVISDSTSPVKVTIKVKTSAGYKEGKSICYYSDTGKEGSYIEFFKTASYEHSQDLFLTGGGYKYFIRCTDLGGNSDYKTINFKVKVDTSPPVVVRAYKEESFLKLITDENAECVYSTFDCNYEFKDGTQMRDINGTKHFISWDTNSNLYVKCKDDFGNQPMPNQCSMVVKPSDF